MLQGLQCLWRSAREMMTKRSPNEEKLVLAEGIKAASPSPPVSPLLPLDCYREAFMHGNPDLGALKQFVAQLIQSTKGRVSFVGGRAKSISFFQG